ncbi:Transposase InsO and inactivated derivatives (Tra5) [Fructobacillus evanidus]|uniref:Transposase InsO and inactivated derivatives (Tra5) n=5 Tax=Fructobacillus evanidus TaxID=3064281 RepID=A0ABM9N2R3_9LACO|nr:Transposase InsO and inactivated derivatives (Tra5) [Fructobacillus sp. LMG 32999]CAK1255349.1 Transposase InsO and inactivated derivatives (Tra5) [Fructobacillus sp. LMG 32999]
MNPEIWTTKFRGFTMSKLSKEDKVNIYYLWKKQCYSPKQIGHEYKISSGNVQYLVSLIDKHGLAILEHAYQSYSDDLKLEIIQKALDPTRSIRSVALEYALPSRGMVSNWLRSYRENGYTIVTKKKGRKPNDRSGERTARSGKSQAQERKPSLTREELEATYHQRIYKKIRCLSGRTNRTRKTGQAEEITQAVTQLRRELKVSLTFILATINGHPDLPHLSRSDYYYTLQKVGKDTKNEKLMNRIRELFEEHHARYGYRRITLQLKREGMIVNHKKVQRLMTIMGLVALHNRKRAKYSSYQGTIGVIKENKIKQSFHSEHPDQKWYADITEFKLNGQKTYLSALLDGCTQEVISYEVSRHPNLAQTISMMEKAVKRYPNAAELTFHTDQGWQYQNRYFQNWLSEHGMNQSMSRKGKSTDNGLIESFFGTLKREMFFGFQQNFQSISALNQAIKEYIHYYNTKRIKSKLKGLTPIEYRASVLKAAQ